MPKIDDLVPSKSNFLKKEDVGVEGRNLTIKAFEQEDIKNQETGGVDQKYCIFWTDESFHPMVLNKENASRLKMALKTDDTDVMIGRTVNVYHDEFVSFGGKQVGGLRIRPANMSQGTGKARTQPARQATYGDADDGRPTPPAEAYES